MTKTKSKSARFTCATSPSLELILEPADTVYNQRGVAVDKHERTAIKFKDFEATLEAGDKGGTVVNGRKQPMDFEDVIKALENHPRFGSSVWREADDDSRSLGDLREEAATADTRRIAELLEEERNGPNRAQALSILAEAALVRSSLGHAPTVSTPPLRPDSAGTHQPEIARDGSYAARSPENPDAVLPPEGGEFPDPIEFDEPLPDSAGSHQPLPPATAGEVTFTSDAAEEKAKELGVDPRSVKGTGKDGAIKVADVESAARGEGDDGESGNAR